MFPGRPSPRIPDNSLFLWNHSLKLFLKKSVAYWLKLISLPTRRMSFCGYDRKTSKSGYFREYSWSICIDTFSISYFKCQEKFHYQLFLIYNLYDMVTYCSTPVPHSSPSPWLVLQLEIIFKNKAQYWLAGESEAFFLEALVFHKIDISYSSYVMVLIYDMLI